jgi:hypothetical protein
MVEIVYKYTVKQPGVRYIALNVVSYDLASEYTKFQCSNNSQHRTP